MGDPTRLAIWIADVHATWGWTQRRMAQTIGVSTNTLLGYQRGATPQAATLRAIATTTGVTVDQLRALMDGQTLPVPEQPPAPADNGTDDRVKALERQIDRLTGQVEALTSLLLRQMGGQ